MSSFKAVIMAGGAGTRLWPLSRASYPKQFLSLNGQNTMLQTTVKRLTALEIDSFTTVCNEDHRFFVAEQLREIDSLGPIILEPVSRNTAPAIALAAFLSEPSDLLFVVPADHVVDDTAKFIEAIKAAECEARSGKLVTFGIVPSEPATGYGYIKMGSCFGNIYEIEEFVEKPALKTAKKYVKSNQYLWNSGMFMFTAGQYLDELKSFRRDIYDICEAASASTQLDLDFTRLNQNIFEKCPSESIDYAIMENTKNAIVMPMNVGWSDIGTWSSLWEIQKKDNDGNVCHGDVIAHETENSYMRTDDRLMSVVGVKDLIVISTKDAVMVARKDKVQDTKALVDIIKSQSRTEWDNNREVYRPWGKFDCIDIGDGYKVKRITVKPHAKLSVQKHHHRAEHWIVVSGTAKVTNGQKTYTLNKNQSTYIPLGEIHSLENPDESLLEIIEVQSGDYLGEDDIVRFEDIYGRAP